MSKIIVHCHNPDNLIFVARAAKYCIEANMSEGEWKVLSYGEGRLSKPVYITALKRKSCITIYDQKA